MPFTFAHPAAVLPLRRSRYFDFPALVVGSVIPDAGYFFGRWNVDNFSHSLMGSLAFDLPMGIILVILFYALRLPFIGILPKQQRQIFFPLCQRPAGNAVIVLVSVLIGIWVHLLLDSFTHKNGWIVQHLPALQIPVWSFQNKTLRVYNVLWFFCSFVGIAWLYFVYGQWKEISAGIVTSTAAKLRNGALIAFLILPVAAVHIFVSGLAGLLLTAVLSVFTVIFIVLCL
jgi:hypothetical protein